MKLWTWVFTTPALYTLCVSTNASTAHTMWMPCYLDCTCTLENASNAGAPTSFNYWRLLSGVPAMFVTVWATVRAVYADTEWVCITHTSVIATFTQFVDHWASEVPVRAVEWNIHYQVSGVILFRIDQNVFLFAFLHFDLSNPWMCHNATKKSIFQHASSCSRNLWRTTADWSIVWEPRAKLAPSGGLEGLNYIFPTAQRQTRLHAIDPSVCCPLVFGKWNRTSKLIRNSCGRDCYSLTFSISERCNHGIMA